jgi:hypothetical protein
VKLKNVQIDFTAGRAECVDLRFGRIDSSDKRFATVGDHVKKDQSRSGDICLVFRHGYVCSAISTLKPAKIDEYLISTELSDLFGREWLIGGLRRHAPIRNEQAVDRQIADGGPVNFERSAIQNGRSPPYDYGREIEST